MINPNILEEPKQKNGGQRNGSLSVLALIKNAFASVLDGRVLKVETQREQQVVQSLERLYTELSSLNKRGMVVQNDRLTKILLLLRNMEQEQYGAKKSGGTIAKATMDVQQLSSLAVANLEKLDLNIENLDKDLVGKHIEEIKAALQSLQQLAPISSSLRQSGLKTDDSNRVLRQINGSIASLGALISKNGDKEIIFPTEEIIRGLQNVNDSIKQMNVRASTKVPEIKIPAFPDKVSFSEGKAILKALQGLTEAIQDMPTKMPQAHMPKQIEVSNFPVQKIPQPVTNININPLRGYAKSRNITVTTTPTPLPDEVLSYRRSIIVFNNSGSTIYIGGQDVSSTNGLPVLTQSYSPALDAGPRLIVYGVVASSTANVRVFEVSNENIGG